MLLFLEDCIQLFFPESCLNSSGLFTGTSSGLGEQFVYSILARGDRVIATARRTHERLNHLKDAGAAILDVEVSAPQSELDASVKEALKIRYMGGSMC